MRSPFLALATLMLLPIGLPPVHLAPATQAQEQEQEAMTPQEVLIHLFEDESWDETLFTPAFLAAVSLEDVRALVADLRETLGSPLTVEGGAGSYVVSSPTHTLDTQITLDAEGRIAGLFFSAPDALDRSVEDILDAMAGLAPEVAFLVTRNGEVLHEREADAALAVGSTFKLGVLAVLADRIAEGTMAWTDVVSLEEGHVALPTGILQDFPLGAPLTLHTAAALMISRSDNTATDLLMDHVGRAAVADRLGVAPVLTTRELTVLKADAALRDRFLGLDPDDAAGQEALFAAVAQAPLPGVAEVSIPHQQGIEWYLSARTLCALIEEVAALDVFAINPGLARPADWQRIAYKGGSEIGVLNFTTHLVSDAGDALCVTATWNAEAALEEGQAASLYAALLARLED